MCKLLYYPYISIPNSSWLIQALLYWDGIATIVPVNIMKHPEHFSPFARKLVQEGLIETVQPEEYAFNCPDYYLSFLEWARANSSRFTPNFNGDSALLSTQYNIHAGKLGYIGDELVSMGLAERIDEHWFSMDSQLSESFMTFLAMLIGQETGRIPSTDTYHGMSSIFCIDNKTPTQSANIVKNSLRNSMLNQFLPIPSTVHSLNDIQRFKERYRDKLINFRAHVENYISSLESLPIEVREIKYLEYIASSKDEIEQLKGHMRFFKAPKIDMGTLVAAIPSAFEAFRGNYLEATAGIAPLLFKTVWNDDRNGNLKKPLAYAALFQDRFSLINNIL